LWCEGRIQQKIIYIDLRETAEGTGGAVHQDYLRLGADLDARQN
jgi:hypothetical protein